MVVHILSGHVLDVLSGLPERHFQAIVTSPPFWGLRAYGTEPQVWGGTLHCAHEWEDSSVVRKSSTNGRSDLGSTLASVNAPKTTAPGLDNNHGKTLQYRHDSSACCRLCHAWRGELGGESIVDCLGWARGESPAACLTGCYLCHLRLVMADLWRVLRDDGLCFVELGDGYASKWPCSRRNVIGAGSLPNGKREARPPRMGPNIREKSLILVPERFRLAMIADGWIVRSVIRQCKRAPMPESVRDRPTSAVSEVVMLAKQPSYFSDMYAVREPYNPGSLKRYETPIQGTAPGSRQPGGDPERRLRDRGIRTPNPAGRNPRNYSWLDPDDDTPMSDAVALSPERSNLAHYATFGPKAVTPFLKMATSERGCCAACGAAHERIVMRSGGTTGKSWHDHTDDDLRGHRTGSHAATGWESGAYRVETTGWRPRCDCGAETVPCRALDPFGGTGTVGLAADRLGLDCTLIDLNPVYASMATDRIRDDAPLFANVISGSSESTDQF